MGIEHYEPEIKAPENDEEFRVDPEEVKTIMEEDYFLDEEDGDHPAVEPVEKKKEGPVVKTYKVHYTTNKTDFKEITSVIIPVAPSIDLKQASDAELIEVVSQYENIPDDVEISISGVEEIFLEQGELPFALKPEGSEDVIKHED